MPSPRSKVPCSVCGKKRKTKTVRIFIDYNRVGDLLLCSDCIKPINDLIRKMK